MRLIVESLAAQRGGENVFSGLSFEVATGEAIIVTGENGSGKSTLLKTLAGLVQASAGRTRLSGFPETFTDLASASHYLGHENGMKPALSVAENLEFWRDFCGDPNMTVDEALGTVGLESTAALPFGYLSTGQRRRIAIARLLVSHRPVWLLDEPTAGLDLRSERRFTALMEDHLEDGGIIVAATHVELGLKGGRELRMGTDAA